MRLTKLCTILGLALSTSASAAVLYDGNVAGSPTSQGFLSYLPSSTFYVSAGGKTTLNTTANNGILAGFYNYDATLSSVLNPAMPTLDHSQGYLISLDMQMISESHTAANRAGFSLLAISSDLQGVELDFWTNQIGTQNIGFTAFGETASNTNTTRHVYDLLVQGSSYTLYSDGTSLLTGPLRDYSSFVGAPIVYAKPNLLAISDNTTSGSASVDIYKLTAVPEPSIALLAGLPLLLSRRKRNHYS